VTAEATAEIWEHKYSAGHRQLYPWDMVVSFVFRYAPRDRLRADVRVLEVGCGTGSNLWFAAREGFSVAGIDCSESAISFARRRFDADGLSGDLRVGRLTDLAFADQSFDLVIDRGAITCVGFSAGRRAVNEAARVLRSGGFFLFNPYAATHSSAAAKKRDADGLIHEITEGTLTNTGSVCFYGHEDVERAFGGGQWVTHSFIYVEQRNIVSVRPDVHAEWRVIVSRK